MKPNPKQHLLQKSVACFILAALLFASCVNSTYAACSGYAVVQGDGLYRIAISHGETLSQLLTDNGLTARSVIRPGDCLKISVMTPPRTVMTQSDIPWHPVTYGKSDTFAAVSLGGVTFAIDRKYILAESDVTDENFTFDHWVYMENDPTVVLMAHNGLAGQYLYALQPGDIITLYNPDGSTLLYRVTGSKVVPNMYGVSMWQKSGKMILRTCWPQEGSAEPTGLDLDVTAELVK